ncbi:hypothetical protein EMCRGX_G026341 [Ephydatia muelleri]
MSRKSPIQTPTSWKNAPYQHLEIEAPAYVRPCFYTVDKEFRDLLSIHPGVTKAVAIHNINTVGPPARVSPRRIPVHFQEEIGVAQVIYLGHVFSAEGMTLDNSKVKASRNGPGPEMQQKLTQKDSTYCWNEECEQAFRNLKTKLTEAPILAYPRFDKEASPLVLQTDASLTGLGAVLEQDGQVIAYASRTLSMSEVNYSVIQRERLALVWGTKQFRHYLLGRPFQLWTDHEPLKWLAGQKMEGILCRWAIALQEYTYTLVYRKGTLNGNADALSRRHSFNVMTILQLATKGTKGTLHRLRQQAYWVSMAQDVEQHCRECQKCQSSKLCTPTRAPLHSLQTVHTNKSTTPQPPNCAHQQEHHSTASKLCTPTRAPLHSLQTVHTNKSTTPQPPNCAHQQEHHSTASKLCTPTRAPLHSLQTVHTNKSTTPQPSHW